MSTRVHELAKKLDMKSADLIDRIQKGGFEVKLSPLASLDEDMVEKIVRFISGGTPPSAGQASAPSEQAAPARPRPAPTRAETSAPTSSRPSSSPSDAHPHPVPTQVHAPRMTPGSDTATLEPPRPASGPAAANPPVAPPATPRANENQGSQEAGSRPRIGGNPPTSPLSSTRPATAPSAGQARPAGPKGAGPLAGHTHRTPGQPTGEPRPSAGQPSAGHGPGSHTPAQPSGPVRRGDYISPTGTRISPSQDRPTAPLQPRRTDQAQRPPEGQPSPGGPRPSRPLPSVANLSTSAPAGGIRRPGAGPRPTGPEERTQRPDVKYTPAQLRDMARAGRLPGGPAAPTPAAPGGVRTRPMGPASQRGPQAGAGPGLAPSMPMPSQPMEEDDDRGSRNRRGGANAGREQRQAERKGKQHDRKPMNSPLPASALLDEDDSPGLRRQHRHHKQRRQLIAPRKTEAFIEPPVTIRYLSETIGIKASDLMKKILMQGNVGVNINSTLDDDTAMELALEFGVTLTVVHERTAEDDLLDSFEATDENQAELAPRPPVITVLGHVDHGKTSLLDRIRKANVVASESGGITQHIGAYKIEHNGHPITFVDTPGHEAFTAMRARGANVTDLVVLVVAADDGVMPQTIEAIAHAKAADVPVVVALNKIDLPNVDTTANINKIYGELSQQGLNPSEWGGDTEVIKTSSHTGEGFDALLSTLETLAELLELKSNPNKPATGTCLEALVSEGRGVVATVLVQDGTLRVGDVMVCGDGFGRVRALIDDQGRSITEAGPSTPVEVSGLDAVPTAGEKFAVMDDISRAREIAETRRERGRGAALLERQPLTLENVYSRMSEQKIKTLNLIMKADVQGSIEALTKELEKLKNDEVPIRILLKAVGGITESDVSLAEASDAIIIGFRVAPEDRAITLAEEKKIDIRRYDIIYQVTDEIKKAVEGMLVPEVKDVHLGRANVRQVFKISRVGTIAGCFVTQGIIERGAKARIIRDSREIYKGTIEALKRFKDDIREVRESFECGIKISNYDDIKIDDTIEVFRTEIIRRTL